MDFFVKKKGKTVVPLSEISECLRPSCYFTPDWIWIDHWHAALHSFRVLFFVSYTRDQLNSGPLPYPWSALVLSATPRVPSRFGTLKGLRMSTMPNCPSSWGTPLDHLPPFIRLIRAHHLDTPNHSICSHCPSGIEKAGGGTALEKSPQPGPDYTVPLIPHHCLLVKFPLTAGASWPPN